MCTDRFNAGNIAGKQRTAPIGMPRSDPNGEIGVVQMADNAWDDTTAPKLASSIVALAVASSALGEGIGMR